MKNVEQFQSFRGLLSEVKCKLNVIFRMFFLCNEITSMSYKCFTNLWHPFIYLGNFVAFLWTPKYVRV